jgi:hypothetical protein
MNSVHCGPDLLGCSRLSSIVAGIAAVGPERTSPSFYHTYPPERCKLQLGPDYSCRQMLLVGLNSCQPTWVLVRLLALYVSAASGSDIGQNAVLRRDRWQGVASQFVTQQLPLRGLLAPSSRVQNLQQNIVVARQQL